MLASFSLHRSPECTTQRTGRARVITTNAALTKSTCIEANLAAPDVTQKAEIYETLSSLNLAFAGIVQHLQTMQKAGVLTSKYAYLFQGFTQEILAEINLEVLECMDSIESQDWSRFGKVRQKWEKYLRFETRSAPKPRKKKMPRQRTAKRNP